MVNGDRKREAGNQEDLICLCCRLMTTIYQKRTRSLGMFGSIVTNIYSISFFVFLLAWIAFELPWFISFGSGFITLETGGRSLVLGAKLT